MSRLEAHGLPRREQHSRRSDRRDCGRIWVGHPYRRSALVAARPALQPCRTVVPAAWHGSGEYPPSSRQRSGRVGRRSRTYAVMGNRGAMGWGWEDAVTEGCSKALYATHVSDEPSGCITTQRGPPRIHSRGPHEKQSEEGPARRLPLTLVVDSKW